MRNRVADIRGFVGVPMGPLFHRVIHAWLFMHAETRRARRWATLAEP
jgi:hypothetical protein